ncbi:MAG: class I SAM-dependent methyltransferase [Rhodospirillales bacterium]
MHKHDEASYRRFAAIAKSLGRSLEAHYALMQAEQRDAEGAVPAIAAHERRGLDIALPFIEAQDQVLVLGCGAGAELDYLKRAGKANLTGLDISPRLVREAGEKHGVPTLVGDMAKTNLSDRSFDVVLCHRALHHLFYPFIALEEMARLARKTVLIVDEPARAAVKIAARKLLRQPVLSAAGIFEYQFATDDVVRYLGFNGFACARLQRYWETSNRAANSLGNMLMPFTGNRFVGVFQRLKVMA